MMDTLRRTVTRLFVVMLMLTLTACATVPLGTPTEVYPEASKTEAVVTCASRYVLTLVLLPFVISEAVILAVITPVTILIDKDKTLEQWRDIGQPLGGCVMVPGPGP